VQFVIWVGVERVAGIKGNPVLQVGGEHEVVTVEEPTKGVVIPQDKVQPDAGAITAG
jgi:hypothetical protein